MKISTVWSTTNMELKERLVRTRDELCNRIGFFIPLRVRYFVTINMLCKATIFSDNVPATTLEYILEHLEAPKNIS